MSENPIPSSPADTSRPGKTLPYRSLAPRFDRDRHQFYLDLLERAIEHEQTRNVALTGAYGTGKSSVIDELLRETPATEPDSARGRLVGVFKTDQLHKGAIRISLSTSDADAGNSDGQVPGERSNRIQKEIVKQLLYRLAPVALPRSQFHRAAVTNTKQEWTTAAVLGVAGFTVLAILGLVTRLVNILIEPIWQRVLSYPVLIGVSVCIAWSLLKLARGKPIVSASVDAGPAKITLSPQSTSYFDDYLDEIVYFFQVSGCSLVVIEDIDRFEDVQIFDTLRALNGLLNEADQIEQRVVFVYAIRDSVFQYIGGDEQEVDGQTDRAREAIARAGRTKFFDVIVPIVPFINSDNARDLLSAQMRSDRYVIDPALIRLAARHVADMRTMHNIRNEFEVYRARLLESPKHLPDITDDIIFAIVLFKNTHLEDFERIQHKLSSLDALYDTWRILVREATTSASEGLRQKRRDRDAKKALNKRAERLGSRLEQFRADLLSAVQVTTPNATLDLDGPIEADSVDAPDAWRALAEEGEQRMSLVLPTRAGSRTPVELTFSTEQLSRVLATALQSSGWQLPDEEEADSAVRGMEARLTFLRHHTWQDLTAASDVTLDPRKLPRDHALAASTQEISFNDAINALLESDLARELVRNGFLTNHFALYATQFYGNHVSYDATEYIRRSIEPGVPDATFALADQDIEQIFREQQADKSDSAELFNDVSILNLSILDYLIKKRPEAARVVAEQLSRHGDTELPFLDLYATQGEDPAALIGLLATCWPNALGYAVTSESLDEEVRVAAVDAALGRARSGFTTPSPDVGLFISEHYASLAAVTKPETTERAAVVMRLLRSCGSIVGSLQTLNRLARDAAILERLFPLTADNLQVVVGSSSPVSLDSLREHEHAYSYVLDELPRFMQLARDWPQHVHVLRDVGYFELVVNEVSASAGRRAIGDLISLAPKAAHAADLRAVSPMSWPFLVSERRTDPSAGNVHSYVNEFGLDRGLGKLLGRSRRITGWGSISQDDRNELALTVVTARESMPSTTVRVAVAKSLHPSQLDPARLASEGGDLFARLLKAGLVADGPNLFDAGLVPDWATLEQMIAASTKFESFMLPQMVPAKDLASLIRSAVVSNEIKKRILNDLAQYLDPSPRGQGRAIAAALADGRWRLRFSTMDTLRAHRARRVDIVRLIALAGETLGTVDLKQLLRDMGGEYRQLANGGKLLRPNFPDDSDHMALLERFRADTVRDIKPRNFSRLGARLVAILQ
ncbi:hypothetical protein [Curtobacterium poinsettiae]|uniref:YobI family P-loop NTPase n=1 Tax=Curtobacterium poinsettiae TaxID=159612 RepID=UPI0021C5E555|nr:hypothetical protein [Curtobacterium flaccumfaciens]MCU0116570.1 hypothetical protein [Curtobacterium flaccumfaciens]